MKADIALFDVGLGVFPDHRLCLIFNLGGKADLARTPVHVCIRDIQGRFNYGSLPDADFHRSHWASFERPERSPFVLSRRFTCSGAFLIQVKRPALNLG
jgi:hypothetical protein